MVRDDYGDDGTSPEPSYCGTNSSMDNLKDPNFRLVLLDYFMWFYATSRKALYLSKFAKIKSDTIDGFRLVLFLPFLFVWKLIWHSVAYTCIHNNKKERLVLVKQLLSAAGELGATQVVVITRSQNAKKGIVLA